MLPAAIVLIGALSGTAGAIGAEPEITSTYQRIGEPAPLDATFAFDFLAGTGYVEQIFVILPDGGQFDMNSPLVPLVDDFIGIQPDDAAASLLSGAASGN